MDPLLFNLDAPSQPACGTSRTLLRRFHAGELPEDERQNMGTHAQDCLDCQAVLEELKSDDAAFRTHIPFAKFVAQHEARKAKQQPAREGWRKLVAWFAGGGVTMALVAAGAVVLMPKTDPALSTERLKGRAPALGFLLKTSEGVRTGREGEQLHQGDQIQFMVRARPQDRAMVVLGIDGKGAITVYHAGPAPAGAQEAATPLSDSVVLDDAEGVERFFVVTAEGEPRRLREAAETAAQGLVARRVELQNVERLPLELASEQDSIIIEKVRR